MSSKPQQGTSAALDEPFGVTATAADEAGTKVQSRQGVRPPNASESQILRELALRRRRYKNKIIDTIKVEAVAHFSRREARSIF